MKIRKEFELDKVISTDETRSAICNALVARTKAGTVAVATNGRSMAIVPCEVESDTELGLVSAKAIVQGRKASPKRDPEMILSLNGNISFVDGSALPRPSEQECGAFPKWEQCVPEADRKVTFKVAFNPGLLLELAKAIGAGFGVWLEFSSNNEAIIVTKHTARTDGNGAKGVLMPLSPHC